MKRFPPISPFRNGDLRGRAVEERWQEEDERRCEGEPGENLVMEFVRLFEPLSISCMRIPTRIVMPAMAVFYADRYSFTNRLKAFYRKRAMGEVGLIIMGPLAIDKVGSNPRMAGLFDDSHVASISEFVREIHGKSETRLGVQLMHLGRYASSAITGATPIAPSPVATPITGEVPREMEIEDIERVQDAFVGAALRAKEAGIDYVEIIAAGGYLIGEFLSPVTNQRMDGYGGSPEKRMRFGLEVVKKVRRALGNNFPVGMRASGHDFVKGGNTLTESVAFCIEAEKEGIDCINVTGGWHETDVPQITSDVPPGTYVHLARAIREKVRVPVFASNRLGDPDVAERVLRSGAADAVCWGRPLIADPDLPAKARHGKTAQIVPCIGCNQGCLDSIFSGLPVWCTVNPRVGREADTEIKKKPKKRRIYVAGGGPAGLQFALEASQKGHHVSLYEKENRLGGQVNLVAAVPGKEEFSRSIESLESRAREAGVSLNVGQGLTSETLGKDRPDLLVVASGAREGVLNIPGINRPHVVTAWNVLAGVPVRVGSNVVIVGGGATGCETALYLARLSTPTAAAFAFLAFHDAYGPDTLRSLLHDSGRKITILEIADRPAASVGISTRWGLLKSLRLMGIASKLGVEILRVDEDAVLVKTTAGIESIPADMVVIAAGSCPVNDLARSAKNLGIETITIGDAKEPGRISDAVREAFEAALHL